VESPEYALLADNRNRKSLVPILRHPIRRRLLWLFLCLGASLFHSTRDLSQWEVLRSVAEAIGLDADEMQREVASGKYEANVADQVRWAYQIGVTGVPTYAINDRYAIVGAQPYEVFKNALEKIMNTKD
jgi:predicted DsbA family dithiol-disulfide isomerase